MKVGEVYVKPGKFPVTFPNFPPTPTEKAHAIGYVIDAHPWYHIQNVQS